MPPAESRALRHRPYALSLVVALATAAISYWNFKEQKQQLKELCTFALLQGNALSFLDALEDNANAGRELPLDLLDSLAPTQRMWLLRQALEDRSLAGVQLLSSHAKHLDSTTLAGLLTDVAGWCASRSLRFRLQDFLIGRAKQSTVDALRHGDDDTVQAAIQDELLARVPALQRRGVMRLHGLLRHHLKASKDTDRLLREQVRVDLQDRLAVDLCSPFLLALVEGGGVRDAPTDPLRASHLATLFSSMANGLPLLKAFLSKGYHLDQQGVPGAFDRCLACAVCCLKDGVTPTGNSKMPFSAKHSAAFAGNAHLLAWLEEHQPGSQSFKPTERQPTAQDLLFNPAKVLDATGTAVEGTPGHDLGGWPAGKAPASLAAPCGMHQVDGHAVVADPVTFFDRFVRGGQPVVIRGLLYADPALEGVTSTFTREALLARLGDTSWEVGGIPYQGRYLEQEQATASLKEFVGAHIDGCPTTEVCTQYVFAERFVSQSGRQRTVQREQLAAMPTWAVQARVRPAKGTQFYLGGPRSGAPLHFHQAAYNLLVYGQKRWYLTPPAQAAFSMRPANEWVAENFEKRSDGENGSGDNAFVVCDQHAGDVVVLPDLWGHLTENLATSVGIAQEFMY